MTADGSRSIDADTFMQYYPPENGGKPESFYGKIILRERDVASVLQANGVAFDAAGAPLLDINASLRLDDTLVLPFGDIYRVSRIASGKGVPRLHLTHISDQPRREGAATNAQRFYAGIAAVEGQLLSTRLGGLGVKFWFTGEGPAKPDQVLVAYVSPGGVVAWPTPSNRKPGPPLPVKEGQVIPMKGFGYRIAKIVMPDDKQKLPGWVELERTADGGAKP